MLRALSHTGSRAEVHPTPCRQRECRASRSFHSRRSHSCTHRPNSCFAEGGITLKTHAEGPEMNCRCLYRRFARAEMRVRASANPATWLGIGSSSRRARPYCPRRPPPASRPVVRRQRPPADRTHGPRRRGIPSAHPAAGRPSAASPRTARRSPGSRCAAAGSTTHAGR